jgi:hypothetical protein
VWRPNWWWLWRQRSFSFPLFLWHSFFAFVAKSVPLYLPTVVACLVKQIICILRSIFTACVRKDSPIWATYSVHHNLLRFAIVK